MVIAVNGLRETFDSKDVLYPRLSRAMDLAVIVGSGTNLSRSSGRDTRDVSKGGRAENARAAGLSCWTGRGVTKVTYGVMSDP